MPHPFLWLRPGKGISIVLKQKKTYAKSRKSLQFMEPATRIELVACALRERRSTD